MNNPESFASYRGRKFSEGKKYNEEFCRIFCPARLSQYYEPIFGFNIVRFDQEIIKTPDGKSMANIIKKQYGERAEQIISELIGL